MQPRKAIICRKCQFYYITWDYRRPHGCRAMKFKSRRPPSIIVHHNSGRQCLRFLPKDDPNADGP
jgi:hypothetical protein